MMGIGVDGPDDEGNVRGDDCVVTRFDRDLCTVVTATEEHFPFGHFEPRVMSACHEAQRSADNKRLGFWSHQQKWPLRRLLRYDRLQSAMVQFNPVLLPGRLVPNNAVLAQHQARPVAECHRGGAFRPNRLERLATLPRLAFLQRLFALRSEPANLTLN